MNKNGCNEMELYIHIPFCVQKCKYCDFLSMAADEATKERYVEALMNEIAFYGRQEEWEQGLETVYFGGGTPTVIGSRNLIRILDCVRSYFRIKEECEITIELNPATIDGEGLKELRLNGVNRLSIGLQSARNEELKLLGGIHSYEEFLKAFREARIAGFKNVNVDLISSLPGQRVEDYKESLQKVIWLGPEHISAYSLILEEGTPFYDSYVNHPELLPDEDTDREMYHLTKEMLKAAGYDRYEISNYAKSGFESKHNSGYWKRVPYLGTGLGASSFIGGKRWKNGTNLKEYLRNWEKINENTVFPGSLEEFYTLSRRDEMAEYLYLGLRMSRGVSIKGFERCFGKDLFDVYGKEIAKFKKEGLLVADEEKDRIYLTDFGMDVSNYVFERFV